EPHPFPSRAEALQMIPPGAPDVPLVADGSLWLPDGGNGVPYDFGPGGNLICPEVALDPVAACPSGCDCDTEDIFARVVSGTWTAGPSGSVSSSDVGARLEIVLEGAVKEE